MNDGAFKAYIRETMKARQTPWLDNGVAWACYGIVFILGAPLLILVLPFISLGYVLERISVWLCPCLFEDESDGR